jgi:hypothetical protein
VVPEHTAPEGFADTTTEGTTVGLTVTAILVVAITGLAQVALLVIVHNIVFVPAGNVELEYVEALAPTVLPLSFQL